jgi:hypothetical protein
MSSVLATVVACLAIAALIATAAAAGAWFAPFLAGLASGLDVRSARLRAVLMTAMAAILGWGGLLAWDSLRGAPIGAVSRTVAALAGLPAAAAVTLTATLSVALIQAIAGVWLGRALMSLVAPGGARLPVRDKRTQ